MATYGGQSRQLPSYIVPGSWPYLTWQRMFTAHQARLETDCYCDTGSPPATPEYETVTQQGIVKLHRD